MKGLLCHRGVVLVFGAATILTFCAGTTLPADGTQGFTPAAHSVELQVTETAGIRRFGYPVHARVPFPKGTLENLDRVRLLRGNEELPAQFGVASRWDDGSVQWANVDFNAGPAPLTTETFTLEHGPQIQRARKPRGLAVTETDDAFQVGLFRFRKDGVPLIESCAHSNTEFIAPGSNGLVVTDAAGTDYDFRSAQNLEVQLVKPGPVHVVLRYRGRFDAGAGEPIRFETELSMPNSKSWWQVTHRVRDPQKRLRSIALHTPFQIDPGPLVWDFGTGSWTYGALRGDGRVAVLDQVIADDGADPQPWKVLLGPSQEPFLYEVAAANRPALAEGWGHLSGARQVVAFAIADFGRRAGHYRIALSSLCAAEFRYTAPNPQESIELTVYQHFVGVPVQVGAATSPPSMLNPLVARCPTRYYEQCAVPAPDPLPPRPPSDR